MKKFYSILIVFSIAFLSFPQEARADIEIFQGVINKVKVVTEKATNIIKDVQAKVRSLTDKVNGVYGVYKDVRKEVRKAQQVVQDAKDGINDVKQQVNDHITAPKRMINHARSQVSSARAQIKGAVGSAKSGNFKALSKVSMPSFLSSDITDGLGEIDTRKLKDAVAEGYTIEFGQGGDTNLFKQKEEEKQALQRDNVATTYANALNSRVILNEEQQTLEEEAEEKANAGDEEETRQLLQEINEIVLRMTTRQSRMLGFMAQTGEIASTQATMGMKIMRDNSN